MTTADDYHVHGRSVCTVSEGPRLECARMDAPYLASMWSATVASPRRKTAADLTRGAWPQSVRALAEKTSIVGWKVAGAKVFQAKEVDGRA